MVYTLNVADGCIPSDMSTGKPEQIEEERRLLYVAMTRAKTQLHLIHPLRFFIRQQHRHGDRHVYTPLSRFIPDDVLPCFERVVRGRDRASDELISADAPPIRVDVASKLREMW